MLKNPFTKNSLIKKYKSLINQINALEEDLKELTDGRLPFIIQRELPNKKKENYKVRDLDLVAVRDRMR